MDPSRLSASHGLQEKITIAGGRAPICVSKLPDALAPSGAPRIYSYHIIQICFFSKATRLQIPFFMIKQSNDMISLIDGHDQRL